MGVERVKGGGEGKGGWRGFYCILPYFIVLYCYNFNFMLIKK